MLEDKDFKKTSLSELGEFGLIDHLTKSFEIKHKSTIKGIGDDAAVLAYEQNKQIVVTTDFLVEGLHAVKALRIQSSYGELVRYLCYEC